MRATWFLGAAFCLVGQAHAQVQAAVSNTESMKPMWRCDDPATPFRYTDDEEKKKDPPACGKWVEIRGERLADILAAFGDAKFAAANDFLAKVSDITAAPYPDAGGGRSASTAAVYRDPERFGLKVVDARAAQTGSLVVYDGLGGVLVETRDAADEPWKKQVLYPSAAAGGALQVGDLMIRGKSAPKVIQKP